MDSERRAEIMGRYWARLHDFTVASSGRHWSLELSPSDLDERANLSSRQLDVLRLVADGLNNREIAERLYISEETAKSHIKKILAALTAESRAHAVAIAFRQSLLN